MIGEGSEESPLPKKIIVFPVNSDKNNLIAHATIFYFSSSFIPVCLIINL